ncbi:MAG: ATPase, T2SS/T4P/T4SS family [Candidatus Omnitrophota bacterium]
MIKRYDKELYDELVKKSLASKDVLDALMQDVESKGESLSALLVDKGLFSEKDLLKILAETLRLAFIEADTVSVDKEVLQKVPSKIALYYKFLPIKISGRILTIAVSSPLDIKIQDEIRTQLGYGIQTVLSSKENIKEGIKKNYGLASDTLEGISAKREAGSEDNIMDSRNEKVEDIEKLAEDSSVIKLVNQIILEGWNKRATDIHIEPFRDSVSLRYRIDGKLYDSSVSPEFKNFLSAIISRIKIMSNLNIVERRLPQDGRAIVKVSDQMLDLRISTIPTHFGESVVIRILPTKLLFSLEKLGLSKENLEIFEDLVKKPHGVIFVTGPTGSGKTTTLYACLNKINTKDRKILTIEDPIEYEMSGMIQMQVMPEIGLDFAKGLRSFLRHDPDVIMVGEVRDLETAEIAIRVALTGHLVFSTLHTNDAASGITRLLDIGVPTYLVASSVDAFIAQRLIREICPNCKYEDKDSPQEMKNLIASELNLDAKKIKIFRGKGCGKCNSTGFFGRSAIYEILLLDEEIKNLILKKSPSSVIKKVAVSRGMTVLRQDGWRKVVQGVTTPEEIIQVSPADREGSVVNQSVSLEPDALEGAGSNSNFERRIYDRLLKRLNIRYKVFKSHKELSKKDSVPEEFSVTRNISAGGLVFAATVPIDMGAMLEIKIEMPDEEKPIECLSKVVRVEEIKEDKIYEIAVCFLDIKSGERVKLNKYIKEEGR